MEEPMVVAEDEALPDAVTDADVQEATHMLELGRAVPVPPVPPEQQLDLAPAGLADTPPSPTMTWGGPPIRHPCPDAPAGGGSWGSRDREVPPPQQALPIRRGGVPLGRVSGLRYAFVVDGGFPVTPPRAAWLLSFTYLRARPNGPVWTELPLSDMVAASGVILHLDATSPEVWSELKLAGGGLVDGAVLLEALAARLTPHLVGRSRDQLPCRPKPSLFEERKPRPLNDMLRDAEAAVPGGRVVRHYELWLDVSAEDHTFGLGTRATPSDRGQSPREPSDRGQSPREPSDRGQSPREPSDRGLCPREPGHTVVEVHLLVSRELAQDISQYGFHLAMAGHVEATVCTSRVAVRRGLVAALDRAAIWDSVPNPEAPYAPCCTVTPGSGGSASNACVLVAHLRVPDPDPTDPLPDTLTVPVDSLSPLRILVECGGGTPTCRGALPSGSRGNAPIPKGPAALEPAALEKLQGGITTGEAV
jgi:hypothetical protein